MGLARTGGPRDHDGKPPVRVQYRRPYLLDRLLQAAVRPDDAVQRIRAGRLRKQLHQRIEFVFLHGEKLLLERFSVQKKDRTLIDLDDRTLLRFLVQAMTYRASGQPRLFGKSGRGTEIFFSLPKILRDFRQTVNNPFETHDGNPFSFPGRFCSGAGPFRLR